MSTDADIITQAMDMPTQKRAELAHRLLLSLEDEPYDPNADELWAAEIERRAAAVESGESHLVEWETAIDRIRASLRRKQQP